jgi:protein-disulfide isomerase
MRHWIGGAVAAIGIATGAAAEVDEFDARVRDYILNNPEIILEALERLAEKEAEAAVAGAIAGFPDLFTDPPVHGMGAPDAPVRVVEFFDYKCAPCKAMHPGLKALTADQPDLRIEMRHLPILSPGSERAARFALATRMVAGDAAYERVHDQLWQVKGALNAGVLARVAKEAEVDYDAVSAMMDAPEITARIDYNRDVAIALQVLGTPAFITPTSVRFGQSDISELAELWLSQ